MRIQVFIGTFEAILNSGVQAPSTMDIVVR